jgi:hypothetical protein
MASEDDSEFFMSLINIFIKYYNTANGTTSNLFSDIEYYEDSNDIIDEFLLHIDEFKSSSDLDRKLYSIQEINTEDFDQLFGLRVNDNIICCCVLLIPILQYIAKDVDWKHVEWKIVSLNK